ncbi:GNAT family N-acetyltransferase [Flavobacterium okayamense]|uniref:N-acetyltransferase n=1 Tax=Flavobacterium okayamense TaxID=2830782 RepID=A0ABN6HX49_9FLAO|nr:GNAT family N-acetyltransferase [Flavobacterium okayamense]BCY27401.1 N-acetyltransferase [Flavobacterium okayamense]
MKIVKKIKTIDTYPVRHLVLRKGKPIESCSFTGDDEETTIHLGVFYKEKIIGIASLFKIDNASFKESNQFQLRGMAVLDEFRKEGIGTLLINEAEKICKSNSSDLLWFNARESAVPFYLKLNFKTFGTKFEINGIGPHYVMYKNI